MQCLARVLWRGLFSEHGEPCGGTTVARLVCYFGGGGTQNELRVPASPPIVLAREGHVWTAPGWQELSSRVQQWSEQPCVRPVSAVHVTAGHNALRGSGPGQKHNRRLMLPLPSLFRRLHQAPALDSILLWP